MNIGRLTVTYLEHGSVWSLAIPWRGSKLPQVKAQASFRTPKARPWSAVACFALCDPVCILKKPPGIRYSICKTACLARERLDPVEHHVVWLGRCILDQRIDEKALPVFRDGIVIPRIDQTTDSRLE
jgi:hypothetical protein